MLLKAARWICVISSLLAIAGCDMETLVRNKVPGPLRDLLSSGQPGRPGVKGPAGMVQPPKAAIVQPANNSVFPMGKEVVFRGTAEIPGQPGAKPDLTWTLFKEKGQQGIPLGKALSAKKVLEAGNYRAEFAMTYEGQRVAKSVRFRVVHSVAGRVLTSDGKGLAGTEIILSDLDQKAEVSRTTSGKDGSFSVEIPPEGYFLLEPRQKGFSFNPFQTVVRYQKDAAEAEFAAVKAEIKDIRVTSSPDSDEVLTRLCPDQEACIKFGLESQEKTERVDAFLVRIISHSETLTQLDRVKGATSDTNLAEPGPQALRVKVPIDLHIGVKEVSYRVALKFRDDKGLIFAKQGSESVKLDLPKCMAGFLAEAVAMHQKEDFQGAMRIYGLIADINKKLEDQAPFVPYVEKTHFNRALAYAGMALALPEGDAKRREYLAKALSDLSSVLKVRKKDVQALLLRGTIKQIMGDDESSLEDFSAVLNVDPKSAVALENRAGALIRTKKKTNLSQAVDDLTEAIALEPTAKGLRKTRSETLRLLAKSQDEGEAAKISASEVQLRPIDKNLALEKYLRK
ncbi:MAG: hypothetical protein HY913_15810 [Desulfomonile tiedjei]|nr:hypothetical protein [Desulfomonile tiedjei]